MNKLRIFLFSIYPILIILLLLLCLKRCGHSEATRNGGAERTSQPADTTRDVRHAQEVGNSGDLKITLLWGFPGDIDIHVIQPNNKEICFSRKRDRETGGFLDVDNIDGGMINGKPSAENMYWEHPPRGTYYVKLNYYRKNPETGGQGVCTVVVFQQGMSAQIYKVQMTNGGEWKNVVAVTI